MSAPKVGDLALHKSNQLDARPVVEVSSSGRKIRLDIFGTPTDWIPASNYSFSSPPVEHQARTNLPGNMHPGTLADCKVRGCGPVVSS